MKTESAFNKGTVGFNLDLLDILCRNVETTHLVVENGKIWYEEADESKNKVSRMV